MSFIRTVGAAAVALAAAVLTTGESLGAVETVQAVSTCVVLTNAVGNRYLLLTVNPTGVVEVVPFAPDVVRVRFHFGVLFDREEVAIAKPFANWPAFPATFTDASSTNYLVTTDQLRIEIVKSPKFQVNLKDPAGYDLLRDYQIEYDSDYHPINDWTYDPGGGGASIWHEPLGFKIKSVKVMPANEAYFGLGEYPAPLNRRGRQIQFWNQDAFGWWEYRNPIYASFPFFYGVRPAEGGVPPFSYGVFLNNPVRPYIKFASGLGDTFSMEMGDDQLDYFLFGGGTNHSMANILRRYTELTGQPAMLPKWALGYHQSRHSYVSQQIVTNLARRFRSEDFPCDAIYLDIDTQQDRQHLTFNSGFTDVPGMVNYCRGLGIELVPLVEPCLKTTHPLYGEADGHLHFVKANDGSTHVGSTFLGNVSWLDFSSTPAADWWLAKLTNFLAWTGMASIWNDLNEPNENNMPLNTLYWCDGRYGTSSTDSRRWHSNNKNPFCVLECRVSYECQRVRNPSGRPFVLSRAGWPGIARYAVGWSGDNVSDFEALRFNTTMGLSVMISGQPNFGHDVGGFNGTPSGELLTRWIQSGAVSPFFRNHTIDTSADQEPWVSGEPYTTMNRRWIKFRYEILPYLYTLAYESTQSGVPMNAPTVFHFTSDTNTYHRNETDLMVGSHLLAAPVCTNGLRTRWVYLPAGSSWYPWRYDEAWSGGQWVSIPADLGVMPMFSRAGAIIPMGPAMKYVNEFQPAFLDIHIWPGGTNTFELYEDDGLTTNYLAGGYARTAFTQQAGGTGIVVNVGARSGTYSPGSRSFFLVVHAMPAIKGVTRNGAALVRRGTRDALAAPSDGWAYSYGSRQLVIKFPDSGAASAIHIAYHSDDSDGDGMPDWWETAHGLDPALNDASGNPDGDSRNNLGEYQGSGDPKLPDTFFSYQTTISIPGTFNYWDPAERQMRLVGNQLWAAVIAFTNVVSPEFKFAANDGWTVNWGDVNQADFDPPAEGTADYAGGNIALAGTLHGPYTFVFNEATLAYGVYSAASRDSDGDGMTDAFEWSNGLNPLSRADRLHDEDRDGVDNVGEYVGGTDPLDADSYLFVEADVTNGVPAGLILSWSGVAQRRYRVDFTTNDLRQPAWAPLVPFTNLSGSGLIVVTDTNSGPQRFYRVRATLP